MAMLVNRVLWSVFSLVLLPATLLEAETFDLSGQILYYSNGAPVAGVTVQLHGPTPAAVQTDDQGRFTFAGLEPATWRIEPLKADGADDAITALDAAYALQHVVGLRGLGANQRLACDVTGNGTVSALDASRLLQYKVGLLTSFEAARSCASEWVFVPNPTPVAYQRSVQPALLPGSCERGAIAYEPLTANAGNPNFVAIAFGDCTGNWNPPHTPTPTPSPTPDVVCTPPPCAPDEVFYCPGQCPGGCGTQCATPTPTVTPTGPWIAITPVPDYGTSQDLNGITGNVDPLAYRVAVYVYVQGWWTKPTFASPTVALRSDGTWTANITTGGCDPYSTRIAAFLVPAAYTPPQAAGIPALPAALFSNAVASSSVERGPPQRVVDFAGGQWAVKRFDCPAGPGPNLFSDRPEDVWVDAGGLHLTISQRDGRWYSTEVIRQASSGYGTYAFLTRGRLDIIDPCMVAGFFTWDDLAPPYYREIDIELGRWCNSGDTNNAQYVIQPHTSPGNLERFRIDLTDSDSDLTHVIRWMPGEATFETYHGHHRLDQPPPVGNLIRSWTNRGPDVLVPGNEKVRINFWLFNATAPSNGQAAELVVTDFVYTSPPPDTPTPTPTATGSPRIPCQINECGNGCGYVHACGDGGGPLICPDVCVRLCECPSGWGITPLGNCEPCEGEGCPFGHWCFP